jgi:hypothetical protein
MFDRDLTRHFDSAKESERKDEKKEHHLDGNGAYFRRMMDQGQSRRTAAIAVTM